MRAVILSHVYLDPDRRGKLRALAGAGATIAAAVPGGVVSEDHGVRFVPIPTGGEFRDPASASWDSRAIHTLLADFRPDIVQIEEEPWSVAASRAASQAAKLKIPVVVWSRESSRPAGLFQRRRESRALRSARAAIGANAIAVRRLREGLPGRPVISLPQFGVPLPPAIERTARDLLTIGYVGRLLPDRGVDRLLRACATLMGGWTLTVAGTGPEQESLELLSERLGLASRVRWLAGVTQEGIEDLWSAFDCLVLPADPEADGAERWSSILLEAMARGVVPVVMEGGIPESIVGNAGVVAADDEALAVGLQTLRAYPPDRTRLSVAARQRVLDRFVDAALAADTLRFWNELLAAG